jgi:hypothetical protein
MVVSVESDEAEGKYSRVAEELKRSRTFEDWRNEEPAC